MDMILLGYYMDIWINRMHISKLEPDYMRIDLLYGFYSMVMDFVIHVSCKIVLSQMLVCWFVCLVSSKMSGLYVEYCLRVVYPGTSLEYEIFM